MCDWEDDDGVYFCNQVKKKEKNSENNSSTWYVIFLVLEWYPKKNLREQSAHETENKSCDHDNQVHCLSVFWRKPSFYTETE